MIDRHSDGLPPPWVAFAMGSVPGMSFLVRVDGGEIEVTEESANRTEGRVETWERVHVLASADRDDGTVACRYMLLAPGVGRFRVEMGPFYVDGVLATVEQRTGKAATSAWHGKKPARPRRSR